MKTVQHQFLTDRQFFDSLLKPIRFISTVDLFLKLSRMILAVIIYPGLIQTHKHRRHFPKGIKKSLFNVFFPQPDLGTIILSNIVQIQLRNYSPMQQLDKFNLTYKHRRFILKVVEMNALLFNVVFKSTSQLLGFLSVFFFFHISIQGHVDSGL